MKVSSILLCSLFLYINSYSQGWIKQTVNTSSDLTSVFFTSTDVGYTVAQFGEIFKTTDGGLVSQRSSISQHDRT